MASINSPRLATFLCDGALSLGHAVKGGSDDSHVAKSTATTSKFIGLAQNATTAAEDAVEVALPGGGGKGLLSGTVVMGDLLTQHTDGTLKKIATAGDRIVAQAMQSGVSGDVIGVEVLSGQAYQTEA